MLLEKKILGTPNGKIGDIVFRKWLDKTVGSSYQKNVANPRTEAQMTNRNKFKLLNSLAGMFAVVIMTGLRRAFSGMTYRNSFVKLNSNNGSLSLVSGEWTVDDYSAIEISKGSLTSPQDITLAANTANGVVTLGWVDNGRNGNDRSDDLLCAIVGVKETDNRNSIIRGAVRTDLTQTIQMPEALVSGKVLYCYYFFNNRVGTNCSPNGYVEITIP